MTTIISPTTAISYLNNGIFHNGREFVNKYNDQLEPAWVVFCYMSDQNRIHGDKETAIRTRKFCQDWKIDTSLLPNYIQNLIQ